MSLELNIAREKLLEQLKANELAILKEAMAQQHAVRAESIDFREGAGYRDIFGAKRLDIEEVCVGEFDMFITVTGDWIAYEFPLGETRPSGLLVIKRT